MSGGLTYTGSSDTWRRAALARCTASRATKTASGSVTSSVELDASTPASAGTCADHEVPKLHGAREVGSGRRARQRDDRRCLAQRSVGVELVVADEELVFLGVDHRERPRPDRRACEGGRRHRLDRGDAHCGDVERDRDAHRSGHRDAHAGERARTHVAGDQLDLAAQHPPALAQTSSIPANSRSAWARSSE
jgi:hypothetical protein